MFQVRPVSEPSVFVRKTLPCVGYSSESRQASTGPYFLLGFQYPPPHPPNTLCPVQMHTRHWVRLEKSSLPHSKTSKRQCRHSQTGNRNDPVDHREAPMAWKETQPGQKPPSPRCPHRVWMLLNPDLNPSACFCFSLTLRLKPALRRSGGAPPPPRCASHHAKRLHR